MAVQPIPIAFRSLIAYDLDDLTKGATNIKQVISVASEPEEEKIERTYEDSLSPNETFIGARSGTITLAGDIAGYFIGRHDGVADNPPFFEKGHSYLLTFLSLDIAGGGEMVYYRWLAKLDETPSTSMEAGAVNEYELPFSLQQFGGVNFEQQKPYGATLTTDSTPLGDYDPLYQRIVSSATKTVAAAETIISATDTITNPTGV